MARDKIGQKKVRGKIGYISEGQNGGKMVRGKIEKKMVDVYKKGAKSGKKKGKGPNQKKKNSRTKLIESIVEELWSGAK